MKYYKIIYFGGDFIELENYLEFCKSESINNIVILASSTDFLEQIKVIYASHKNLSFTDVSNFYFWMLSHKIEKPRLFISNESGFPRKSPNVIKVNEYLNTHKDIAMYIPLCSIEPVDKEEFIDDFPFKIYRGSNISSVKVVPCALPLVNLLNFIEKVQILEHKNLVQHFLSIDLTSLQALDTELRNQSILTLFFNRPSNKYTNDTIGHLNGHYFSKFWFIYVFNKYFRCIKFFVEVYLPELNLIYRKIQIFLKR
jgi:hypothetical protein